MLSNNTAETPHTEAITTAIRQAEKEDLEIIYRWTIKLHDHEDDGKLLPHPNFSDNLKIWLDELITSSQSLILLSEVSNSPVGFIASQSIINDNGFLLDPLKGVIHLLWVEPAFRKHHIAKKLVEMTESCFMDTGIRYTETHFTSCNKIAEKFWQQLGYEASSIMARKQL